MIRPFSNGTQYMDWDAHNCGTCERMRGVDTQAGEWEEIKGRCDLFEALVAASIGSGEITDEQARRIGTNSEDTRHFWRCAEWRRKKTQEELWEEGQIKGQGRLW